jgi:hypothetical protein
MNGAETRQAGFIRRCFLARKIHFRADAAGERQTHSHREASHCLPYFALP